MGQGGVSVVSGSVEEEDLGASSKQAHIKLTGIPSCPRALYLAILCKAAQISSLVMATFNLFSVDLD